MSNKKYAFLPLNINAKNKSIQNEFMIDYNNGELYINDRGEEKLLVGEEEVSHIDEIINDIIGDDDVSIEELSYIITQINSFKNSILESDDENSLDFIYSIVRNLILNNINLKNLVNSKISGDGVLSDYDFDDTYMDKLDSIDMYANYYIHPQTQVCNMKYVKSINDKTGNVEITGDDISDLNIDDDENRANRYMHPILPECNLYDNGVSFINGLRGQVNLDMKLIGLNNMKDMGLDNDISQYIELSIDNGTGGYATPNSSSVVMDFFLVDIPRPVVGICSMLESKHELTSALHMIALVGILDNEMPFMYSNLTGYMSFDDISNSVRDEIGPISISNFQSISNRGIEVKIGSDIHFISMDKDGVILVDQEHSVDFKANPTDTGIFYISGDSVVARSHKYYSELGYDNESYAIRGGSYKHIAESINDRGRGILSIASDHEIYMAFVDMYGVVRVIFTNKTNRYTHNRRGGMLHDL